MARGKKLKQKESENTTTAEVLKDLTLVFDTNGNTKTIDLLTSALEKLRPEFRTSLTVLVYGIEGQSTDQLSFLNESLGEPKELMRHALEQNQTAYFSYLSAARLEHKPDLNDLFVHVGKWEDGGVTKVKFNGQQGELKEEDTFDLMIFDRQVLRYLVEAIGESDSFERHADRITSKLSIPSQEINLQKNSPLFPRDLKWGFGERFRFWVHWYLKLPLQEFKSKPILEFDFIKEESIYRLKFVVFALILLIGMPFAAYKAGISGDEFVQYKQGKAIYDWFVNFGEVTDKNRTAVDDPKYLLHLYGSSFDLVTAAFNSVFGVENEYEWRHVLNSLTGWVLLLFCGMIAIRISGYRAGLIAMFLVFVSPRILGHSWNNPKDIPFAMSYMIGLWAIMVFLENFNRIKIKHVVLVAMAIGLSIGIRIGGLLLFAYLFLFTGLYYLWSSGGVKSWFATKNLKKIRPAITALGGISILGYVFGIILWPFALQDPIANPLESLEVMTAYGTSIRQLFEGVIVWSDHLPWYYISKYIAITTPLVVWLGVLPFFVFFFKRSKKDEPFWKFMTFFFFAFPIGYIIYKNSNVYGGWRHALFVYPSITVCSAVGYDAILKLIRSYQLQKVSLLMILLLATNPLIHTFTNHPYQYLYFNEFFGGIDEASGKFETDYYYHSTKEAYEWLQENGDMKLKEDGSKVKVLTNGIYSIRYFARNDTANVRTDYGRYYDRGNLEWDYYICVNSYINPGQLEMGFWPPENAVYTVKVDNTPICTVLKRKTWKDLEGKRALDRKDVGKAIQLLNEAILEDPMVEVAYLNLADAFLQARQFDEGIKTCNALLEIYPNYDKAMYTKSLLYLNKGDLVNCIETSKKIIEVNPKFDNAYYIMGLAYMTGGDANSALNNFKKCIEGMPNFTPAYLAIADILDQQGRQQEAQQYRQVAQQL